MDIFRLARRYGRLLRIHAALIYAWGATALLFTSTFCWSLITARVGQQNADQLVNGYLFENSQTIAGGIFPASHTQLLKWPLFALLRLFGFSANAYSILTILLVLVTIAALAYILYRIVGRRPLTLGTLYLALASMLLLIPGQITGGVDTPLNMAMLTGRNIEYPLFIGVLICFIRARRLRSRGFAAATLLLAALIASDRLFVFLSLGGAALLWGASWLWTNHWLKKIATRWILGSLLAYIAALVALHIAEHFVGRIVADPTPYGFITDWHKIGPAILSTVHALALNLGLSTRSGAWAATCVSVNLCAVLGMLLAARWLLAKLRNARLPSDVATTLSVALLATSIAALVSYVSLDQPHVQNARYISIVLPSGFVLLAVWLRERRVHPRTALVAGGIMVLAIMLGLSGLWRTPQPPLMRELQKRNQRIAAALTEHPVEYLVGNYWRVFPVRLMTKQSKQAVVPMNSCINPSQLLTSSTWRPDVRRHSFAYIASLDSLGKPAPQCFERQISLRYGPPSARVVIAGTDEHSREVLLFYDNGALTR